MSEEGCEGIVEDKRRQGSDTRSLRDQFTNRTDFGVHSRQIGGGETNLKSARHGSHTSRELHQSVQ